MTQIKVSGSVCVCVLAEDDILNAEKIYSFANVESDQAK